MKLGIALAAGVFAPSALHAQTSPTAVWCVFEEKTDIANQIVKQFTVMRCDDGSRRAGFTLVPGGGNLEFDAAQALRTTVFAANLPRIWCVGERTNPRAPGKEATKVRADQAAGIGAGWNLACNLTSTEADAMLTSVNQRNARSAGPGGAAGGAGATPGNWCVFEEKTNIATQIVKQFTVMRCDEGRLRANFTVVPGGGPLDFTSAIALRGSLFGANLPRVWCVGERPNPLVRTNQVTKVRFDQAAGLGAGWNLVCNLTSDEADAMLTSANARIPGPPDWCVMDRRFSTPAGIVVEAVRIHIDQFIAQAAVGFPSFRCNLTFAEAVALEANLESGNPAGTSDPGIGSKQPPIWCVIQRTVTAGGQSVEQGALVRCADVERAGPGWSVVGGPFPFSRGLTQAETINRTSIGKVSFANCAKVMSGSVPTRPAADGSYQCVCPSGYHESARYCVPSSALPAAKKKADPPVVQKEAEKKQPEPKQPEQKQPPVAGALAMSGPPWVKTNVKGGYAAIVDTVDYSATTARQVSVDGTVYRREIQWTFTAPPSSLTPGQEFTITVTGTANAVDKGAPVKLPNAPSAGVGAKGLTKVKGELAWANTGEGVGATYVFRVPPDAKGATITFGGDWGIGTFAAYHYGDHKQ